MNTWSDRSVMSESGTWLVPAPKGIRIGAIGA